MKQYNTIKHIALVITAACLTTSNALAEILDRDVTDPLIVIESGQSLLSPSEDAIRSERAEIQKDTGIPTYDKLWGQRNVIIVHPISEQKAAGINFSKITKICRGRLKLYVHPHPYGDHDIAIYKADKLIEAATIQEKDWEYFGIEFDHESLRIEIQATGWYYEHAFITYRVEEK